MPNKLECFLTPDWKGQPETNTPAYRDHLSITNKMKRFKYDSRVGIQNQSFFVDHVNYTLRSSISGFGWDGTHFNK